VKAALAKLLWERTMVSQPWLARHLHMKSAANVSQVLKRYTQAPLPLPNAFKTWLNSVDL
jgi:hypothetical protein